MDEFTYTLATSWPDNDLYDLTDESPHDIGICQGCGAYGKLYNVHVQRGEECGQYL